MKKLFALVIALGIIIVVGFTAVWLGQAAPFSIYLSGEAPPGQAAYMSMRSLGLFALFLLWAQIMLGILSPLSADVRDSTDLRAFHQKLGIFTFMVAVSHPLFFIWGVFQRTAHFKYDFLLPVFDNGYYQACISIGVIGLYLLAIGFLAAMLRNFRSLNRLWLNIHRVNGGVFVLAVIHSLLIGSDTRIFAAALLIILAAASASVFLGYRLRRPAFQ